MGGLCRAGIAAVQWQRARYTGQRAWYTVQSATKKADNVISTATGATGITTKKNNTADTHPGDKTIANAYIHDGNIFDGKRLSVYV